jgi:hypothetical protein
MPSTFEAIASAAGAVADPPARRARGRSGVHRGAIPGRPEPIDGELRHT